MSAAVLLAIWRTSRVLPVLVVILLVGNLGVYAWTVYRLTPELTALRRTYSELRSAGLRSQQGLSPSLEESFQRAEQDLLTFRRAIPPAAEFTGLIGELFAMANSAGLTLDRVGYDPKMLEDRGLLRYDLVFSVRGDYRQIKTFIHALEQSARIIAIEGLSLAGQESAERGAVNLSIRLSTYFASDRS